MKTKTIKNDLICDMLDYCDKNIIEILELEKVLKPYESINKIRLNQLMITKEFLNMWRKHL